MAGGIRGDTSGASLGRKHASVSDNFDIGDAGVGFSLEIWTILGYPCEASIRLAGYTISICVKPMKCKSSRWYSNGGTPITYCVVAWEGR